uniref:Uncharacterized protein n=1 Tax=Ceratitis capitata TaxID=7213 RepID=W8BSF5_CERCA
MFAPETEDMLPRCAPKPSVPLNINTAAIVRPTVPEVSILFGAQQPISTNTIATTTAATSEPTQQTYAAWKKQVLPKVSFPPAGSEVYSINGHVVSSANATTQPTQIGSNTQITSNLYPLRPVTFNGAPVHTTAISTTTVANSLNENTQMLQYRRSLEQPIICSGELSRQENFKRRSLDACTATAQINVSKPDVLTICAGTQTDATLLADNTCNGILTRLATKDDFQQLLSMFGEMRMEQQRLMNIVESLYDHQKLQSPKPPVILQNAGTQYEDTDSNIPKNNQIRPQYEMKDVEPAPRYHSIKDLPAYTLESPRQPAAQSTAYQPYRPMKPLATNIAPNKPCTEQSMLMNELALKYLPNEKLNDLLQELNISPAAQMQTTPLRPIENVEKRPSDISNASYKYLQKYRLLPEEQNDVKEQLTPIRSPLTQATCQHQQQQERSPYQQPQQRQASPCVSAPHSPMLDLENIRRQPKLI